MALVVEDGSGKADADAYVSVDAVSKYAASRNRDWSPDSDDAAEAAVRVATSYVDSTYRAGFQGYQTYGRNQALCWPRAYVTVDGYYVDSQAVPRELVKAVCEAAIRELASPGCLTPDVQPGTNITSLTADTVSVQFSGDGMSAYPVFLDVDNAVAPLLNNAGSVSGTVARA